MKTCILCKQIAMYSGGHGYSECTPGYDASIRCDKGKWEVDLYMDSTPEYRAKLLSAENCDLFEEYQEESDF